MNFRVTQRAAAALLATTTLAITGCSGTSTTATDASATNPAPPVTASTTATPPPSRPATTPAVLPSTALPTAVAQVITIAVNKDRVTGPSGQVTVKKNDYVQIVVTSDIADKVHLTGYDKRAEAKAGVPTALNFTATIAGTFEVELEKKGLPLLQLKIS